MCLPGNHPLPRRDTLKILRILLWLAASLLAGAALLWSSLASRFPESMSWRRSLGECLPQWDFETLAALDNEPAHLLSRLVQTSLLHVPGMSIQWTALANALLAILLALALARLVRREVGSAGIGRPVVLLVAALLACSPAYGANWLHGERVGRFAVPLLFVTSLLLVGPGRRFGGRALLALLLVAAAPFCHARGAFVFLAVLPALLGHGRTAWIIAVLLVGNIAAVSSFYGAGGFHLAENGVFGSLFATPGATIDDLLRTTGSLWPDFLPSRTADDRLIGFASWLAPALLLWRRPKVEAAVDADQPPESALPNNDRVWWSCVAFGLLSVLFHHQRHGMSFTGDPGLIAQARDELLYGGFLLPIGIAGLLASRIGATVWLLAGGALVVLSLQGWENGAGALRSARSRVERVDATLLMPEALAGPRESRELPTRDIAELLLLEDRGWVPVSGDKWIAVVRDTVNAEPDPDRGAFVGGDAKVQRGTVQAPLLGGQISCVLIGVAKGDEPYLAIGYALLEPGKSSGELTWTVKPVGALPEGAKVRAVGVDARNLIGARIGPTFVVRGGVLVEGGE